MDYVRIIRDLREQKSRLDSAIAQLEALEGSGTATRSPRGRKSMGEAERREVSARIKKYWAKRRKSTGTH
jgi:hypothetical protein